jgi:aryl-alcohol dehydrogenase-like predicted oxidoreductase
MEYGQIEGVNKPISRLAQGTIPIGSSHLEESFALLDAIHGEGCNTFDTAHVYGNGDAERTFGRWVRERGLRDKIVVLDKGAHHNADRKRVTPYDIESDLHDSFARLGFDYIDIYLLHRDDPSVPVGPIVEILNEYQAKGHIGIFGGSNWSFRRVEEANEYAYKHNLKPFSASSPNFSLAAQHEEPWPGCISIAAEQGAEAREWYGARKMALFTWSSLAGGFFSGRFRRGQLEGMDNYFDKLAITSYCYDDNFDRLERAESLAKQYQMTLPQIALAYVMNQPLNIFALVGCQNVQEFRDNVAALSLKLTPEQLNWLESGSPEVAGA